MPAHPFVPTDFIIPTQFEGDGFRLEPLGPEHNARDHAAWMSSIQHIQATPGYQQRDWPVRMSLDANLSDLRRHACDFTNRGGFTLLRAQWRQGGRLRLHLPLPPARATMRRSGRGYARAGPSWTSPCGATCRPGSRRGGRSPIPTTPRASDQSRDDGILVSNAVPPGSGMGAKVEAPIWTYVLTWRRWIDTVTACSEGRRSTSRRAGALKGPSQVDLSRCSSCRGGRLRPRAEPAARSSDLGASHVDLFVLCGRRRRRRRRVSAVLDTAEAW